MPCHTGTVIHTHARGEAEEGTEGGSAGRFGCRSKRLAQQGAGQKGGLVPTSSRDTAIRQRSFWFPLVAETRLRLRSTPIILGPPTHNGSMSSQWKVGHNVRDDSFFRSYVCTEPKNCSEITIITHHFFVYIIKMFGYYCSHTTQKSGF